ncbi:MAG TPA: minor capsid protein [Longimicrobiales bacterium]
MPTDPTAAVVRNLILLQRVGNGLARDARALLLALFDDIAAQLARIDPTAPASEASRRARVEKLLGVVRGSAEEVFAAMHKQVRSRLAELGKQQGEWAREQLVRAIGAVAVDVRPGSIGINLIKSILDTDPIHGRLLAEWFRDEKEATLRRVAQQIRLGMAQNETIGEMVRRIRGRAVGRGENMRFEGGVLNRSTRETEAIVRTAVNHVANEAHIRTYRENEDVLAGYVYTATLDSRTTPICQALDGQFFRLDDPEAKRPPQHVNCRSTIVPRVDWDALGIEPPDPGTRASAGGPVPATMNYEEWLRRQSPEVQDDILGPARAELFRAGKVTLRDLVREDGTVVRVEDLVGRADADPTPEGAREARRAIFGELVDENGAVAREDLERVIRQGRTRASERLLGHDGLDALATELGWKDNLVLKGQDPAKVKARFVYDRVAFGWENENRPLTYALHLAARDEFGLADAAFGHIRRVRAGEALYEKHGAVLRAVLRAQQEATAEYLRSRGIEHLTLLRGIKYRPDFATPTGGRGRWSEQPLASFSASESEAIRFAIGEEGGGHRRGKHAAVIIARIPVDRIVSMPRTGAGKWVEREYVVFGGEMDTIVIDITGMYEVARILINNQPAAAQWLWSLLEE